MLKKSNIIKTIRLTKSNEPTGFTQHIVNDRFVDDKIQQLKIVQYEGDLGFYLFYCDRNGDQITDTYHDSLSLALEQAQLEYNVNPNEWHEGVLD